MFVARTESNSAHPPDDWQRGHLLAGPELCIHQLFDAQVARDPDAVAILSEDRQLTYREFDTQTNQLANRLAELGVGRESIVVVCLPRSIELVAALLAVVKAGGAYLPIAPDWPVARKQLILEELGAKPMVIADPGSADSLGDGIRLVDPYEPALGGYPTDHPDWAEHTTRQLAYINFTSGSTGRPKGVMIEHRSILRLLDPSAPWRIGPGDRLLHLAPAAFDATTLEVWLPLLSGATLVLAPPRLLGLDEIARLLRDQDISTLFLTTGLFHAMADAELPALAGVRQLMTGGEVLDRDSMQAVLSAMREGHSLIAVYGPTESTTFATHLPIRSGSVLPKNRSIPIGRPLAATTALVLDPSGAICPVGIPGELHLGGAGLARGYLNNPGLTAEKFIPDPGSSRERLYRTGDVASWNTDGTLAFHGRVDDQIKVNGIRIEPAEIESAMRDHPAVARALAISRSDSPGHPRLVAYWVPRTGTNATVDDLREFLAQKLPETMIPAAFVAMECLPLNANGKVDRDALPAPMFGEKDRRQPREATEIRLSEIWAEVLGHSDFGVNDNFFIVGGNSLSAIRLQALFKDQFNREFPLGRMFSLPTIEEQAQWLSVSGLTPEPNPFHQCLVTMQPLGERSPIYIMHGVTGELFNMYPLAKTFAPHRPVYGLQALDLDPEIGVKSIADLYATEILKNHAGGPIHLLGSSAGGWWAHAVAACLLDYGAEVGFLGVFDSEPVSELPKRLQIALLPSRLVIKFSHLIHPPGGGGSSSYFLQRVRYQFYRRLNRAPQPQWETPLVAQLRKGVPSRLPVVVDVFCPRDQVAFLRRAWKYYATKGVRCHAMFEEHKDFRSAEFAPLLGAAVEQELLLLDQSMDAARQSGALRSPDELAADSESLTER